jgi:hypothetical protein
MDYRDIIDNLDFETDFLERINDNIMLTKKEIEVLNRYNIDYNNAISMSDLIYKIEDILNYEYDNPDLEDLELVSQGLSERNYYMNTDK